MTSKPTRWEQGAFIHSRQSATWSREYVAECVEREKKMVFCAGQPVAKFMNPEDARRTAACVNACAGLDTGGLEQMPKTDHPIVRRLKDLTEQCDLLMAALEPFARFNSSHDTLCIEVRSSDVSRARAAIAKAKGGTV